MITYIEIQDRENAEKMLGLQIPSYKVEAKLIGFDGIPPLHETVEELQGCGERFWVYEIDGRWAGAIAYEVEKSAGEREASGVGGPGGDGGSAVVISRMMVHPDYFRRGIARALLRHVLQVAEPSAQLYRVSTGSLNEPALQLYRSEGFHETRRLEVAPGVEITFLEKGSCT
ncbi:GNAT family N-acetyltransferase [Tumebacillus flagellatus]|uniref:N-acetyltransferase domain-containing protein n=1 Tax=Tumebacillus flagellatus TaxID=1157490 RepID=A0A074LMX8_9BACL|nr:GNAT family N-acetyltransferase [Tumebacillus flagellatus]KEO81188.1 hypothetical protein EL26_22290 [Tumebacillus flagellatus]